jgi:prepilin-type processing-associated H-X9-DG protein
MDGKPFGRRSALPSNRHSGGANMVFCDGHVEYAKQERWIEASDGARRRWNNDHKPHPETWR